MDEPEVHHRDGPRFVSLLADDGREPAPDLIEATARSTWAAVSAPWHPALLKASSALPRIEDALYPTQPSPPEFRVIAAGAASKVPSGHRTQAEDAGVPMLEGGPDRDRLVAELAQRLSVDTRAPNDETLALVRDFQALGTAVWWLRELTAAMGHVDCLDHDCFQREAFAGADAWAAGDANAAASRLRASFELLTQARERLYPTDAYMLDLVLLDASSGPGALRSCLEGRVPFTVIAQASAIKAQAEADPDSIARLREAITEGWADVAGGAYDEFDEPLRPVESARWQYRKGSAVYRDLLDGRDVETFARRRLGMHPGLPGLARRFGIRYAVALAFDSGTFPVQTVPKKLWEGLDGTALESLTRPPLAADQSSSGCRLAWKMAKSMRDDQVAVLPLAHWPDAVSPWFQDLRRVAAYSPVIARWVTLGDFFHLTDRPWESFRPGSDSFTTPYLAQAVAKGETRPISARAEHARQRALCDALSSAIAVARSLGAAATADDASLDEAEDLLETGRFAESAATLDRLKSTWSNAVATAIAGTGQDGTPGYLLFNPIAAPRRAPVLLPEGAAADLRPEGPLRASQLTAEGVWALVDLPALGFAWVPATTDPAAAPFKPGSVVAKGHFLRNESIEVEFDPTTGGLRGVKSLGEPSPRLAQQLVLCGLTGPDAQPVSTRMKADGFEVEYGGPALAQAVSNGVILDPNGRTIARFSQRVQVWTGRPIFDLEIELRDLAPELTVSLSGQPPWTSYLASRWAWADPQATLRRSSWLAIEATAAERPETAEVLDISTRKQRTALLFGGLAHHQRQGGRMMDTLLLAGRESVRTFRFSVALDLEFPWQAFQDQLAPVLLAPVKTGPPRAGTAGWLFLLESKAVALTRLEFTEETGDGRGRGVVAHVRECDGRSVRTRLRCFRDPTWARQIDEHGEAVVDLNCDGDAVQIDLTPYEMMRVEITLA